MISGNVTSQLIVRNTEANLDLVEALVDELKESATLTFRATVFEAAGTLARQLMQESCGGAGKPVSWQRLLELKDRGKLREVDSLLVETVPNTETSAAHGGESDQGTNFVFDRQGHVDTSPDFRRTGFQLKLKPSLRMDSSAVSVDFTIERHHAPPEARTLAVEHPMFGGWKELPVQDFHVSKAQGSFIAASGATTLVTAWQPENADQDVMQLLFITNVVRQLLPKQ